MTSSIRAATAAFKSPILVRPVYLSRETSPVMQARSPLESLAAVNQRVPVDASGQPLSAEGLAALLAEAADPPPHLVTSPKAMAKSATAYPVAAAATAPCTPAGTRGAAAKGRVAQLRGEGGVGGRVMRGRASSTGHMYVRETMSKPDVEEAVRSIALVVHGHVADGDSSHPANEAPIFNEDTYWDKDRRSGRMVRRTPVVPTVELIFDFVIHVISEAKMNAECPIIGLAYLERIIKLSGIKICTRNWRAVVLSCYMLASKVWDDESMVNVDFSIICPSYTLREINMMERKTLDLLQYNITVPPSVYASYYFELRTLCERREADWNLQPLDDATAARLDACSSIKENELMRCREYGRPRSGSCDTETLQRKFRPFVGLGG